MGEVQSDRSALHGWSLSSRLKLTLLAGTMLVLAALAAPVWAAPSVTLAWDPNPEADIGGYIVYYGAASRNYTNANNVRKVTTSTVSNLVAGTTYYFAVTAYNTNGLESDFSDEVSYAATATNPPPAIGSLPAQLDVNEQANFSYQLTATVPGLPGRALTWQLAPGTPPGLGVDPGTGLLTWVPGEIQGPSTNLVTVVVRDKTMPSLSDSESVRIVVKEINRPPTLAEIPDRVLPKQALVLFTAGAVDPDLPANRLTFSLGAGAPTGARINASSGRFSWRTPASQVPATYTIAVRVTDNGSPSLSATQTFRILTESALELTLGSAVTLAGATGAVAITLDAPAPVTDVSFTLDVPSGGLTDFNLVVTEPGLDLAALQPAGPNRFLVHFQMNSESTVSGLRTLAMLQFRGATNTPSALIPLKVSGLFAEQQGGTQPAFTLANDGRVVLVSREPLVEQLPGGPQRRVLVYGRPGSTYTVECALDVRPPAEWTPVWSGALGDTRQVVNLPATSATSFYRVVGP